MEVSLFKSAFEPQEIGRVEFNEIIEAIKNEEFKETIENYRVKKSKDAKKKLFCYTPCGSFSNGRAADKILDYNGIVPIDIDLDGNTIEDINSLVCKSTEDPYVFAIHRSAGGLGCCLYFQTDNAEPRDHIYYYNAIAEYVNNRYGVLVDRSGKDVSRLRFVSSDRSAWINDVQTVWSEVKRPKPLRLSSNVSSTDRLSAYCNAIISSGVPIADSYEDWVKLAFALASSMGSSGESIFHAISSMSANYERKSSETLYTNALRKGRGSVSENTIFFMGKEHGLIANELRNE